MHPKAKTILEEITSGHKKKEDIDPAHHTLEDVEDFINYDLTHDDDEVVMYSGSISRVGFGVCFSGSGRVRGSTFRGRPPQVSGIFKVKFRIG